MVHTTRLRLATRGHADMHDLTLGTGQAVEQSGIDRGLATIFTPSSTSALTTIEYEPGALEDLRRAQDDIAPPGREYQHNRKWGDGNGHAHLRASLLGPSLTIPIVDGELALGTWQQVLFIDFDVRPRTREVIVQIIGEPTG